MQSPPSETRSPADPAPQTPETFGLLGPVLGGIFLLWILIVAAVAQSV